MLYHIYSRLIQYTHYWGENTVISNLVMYCILIFTEQKMEIVDDVMCILRINGIILKTVIEQDASAMQAWMLRMK